MSPGRIQRTARYADGLARALSKLGYCSRSQARNLIKAGRVKVNGVTQRDPERRVNTREVHIAVDGNVIREAALVYLALNKPRGLITTTSDERGRETVFHCLPGIESTAKPEPSRQSAQVTRHPHSGDTLERVPPPEDAPHPSARSHQRQQNPASLPRVFPVGRLDQASEGLLLFTNDTAWAAQVTAPEYHLDKIYHVQIDCVADLILMRRMQEGVTVEGDFLAAKNVRILRHGAKNSWLEVVLDEGKNRHIRRLLAAFGVGVLRLVRVAIGPIQLGTLAKGEYRLLTSEEVASLAGTSRPGDS